MSLTSKNGSLKDKQNSSFVESLTRPDQSAQEVAIGNIAAGLKDSFGRMRVSNPKTLFQADERTDVYESVFWTSTTAGSATITHDDDKKARIYTVTGNGDSAERRSRRYITYVKGKSQLVYLTGNFKGAVANSVKEYGLADELNGVMVRTNGTAFQVVIRSTVSGSTTETVVSQDDFNIDKLDGNGASGATIDLTKQQVFIISFGWLGSATVSFSIFYDGNVVPFHSIHNANRLETLYSQQGTLPIYTKISSTGASTTMETTCYAVHAEGDDSLRGIVRVADVSTTPVNISATPILVAGVRLQAAYNRASINPVDFAVTVQSGNKDVYWRILKNPTIVGGNWSPVTNSIAEGLVSYTSYSGGEVIDTGYVITGQAKDSKITITDTYLGRDISGNSETLVMEIRTFSSTGTVLFTGRWREDT